VAPFLLVIIIGSLAALQQFVSAIAPFFLKSLLYLRKSKLPTKVVDNSVENSAGLCIYEPGAAMVVFSSACSAPIKTL
jgi:hypothetical protein